MYQTIADQINSNRALIAGVVSNLVWDYENGALVVDSGAFGQAIRPTIERSFSKIKQLLAENERLNEELVRESELRRKRWDAEDREHTLRKQKRWSAENYEQELRNQQLGIVD